jgi:hypothetical protein
MHNARFMIQCMEQRQQDHARLNRHAWQRPLPAKPQSAVRRVMAALRAR